MNFNQMMKQAQTLKKEMEKAQETLKNLDVVGTAGGAQAVTVTLTGKGALKSIRIDPRLACDELLEDLILVAHQHAFDQLEQAKTKLLGPLNQLF